MDAIFPFQDFYEDIKKLLRRVNKRVMKDSIKGEETNEL